MHQSLLRMLIRNHALPSSLSPQDSWTAQTRLFQVRTTHSQSAGCRQLSCAGVTAVVTTVYK